MRDVMPFTIRYAETDKMGVVHHANYLLYLEDAREHFLDVQGFPYTKIEEEGLLSPVLSIKVDYAKPLRYGQHPIIRTRISELKSMHVTFSYEIFESVEAMEKGARPNSTASSVHCIVDAGSFKAVNMKKTAPDLYAMYASVLEAD